MNEIAKSQSSLPAIRGEGELFLEAEAAALATIDLFNARDAGNVAAARDALARAKSISPDLVRRISAVREPASRIEIGVQVAKFLGAMKHLGKVDDEIFVNQLIDDIEDAKPTRIGLATALRQVRQEAEFLPSLAMVLKAIKRADYVYLSAADRLSMLEQRIAEAEAFLNRST